MSNFRLKNNALFAIDNNGIAIIDKNAGNHYFVQYPDAAVLALLIENHSEDKLILMLQSILGKNPSDTKEFIHQCLNKWEQIISV
jgi:hypothetical protein